ncbi:hypothetical protein HYZ99_05475 [Candidatus Peregrinibacteria bacterium]|nr:hypothetical protein [Candidatus Peregrinibacteria bacterium]
MNRNERILDNLDSLLQRVAEEDDLDVSRAFFSGMLRYLMEDGGYHAYKPVHLHHIIDEGILRPGAPLVDLGAGSGEAVKEWAARGNAAVGIDASPSFVAACDLLHLGRIDADPEILSTLVSHLSTNRVVITSLTLDRVTKPKDLVRMMIDQAGTGGNFMLSSLFPVLPEDDENVNHPITYTPHKYRIASTGTEEGDLAAVKEFLGDYSHRNIQTKKLPYTVTTHSGIKAYNNYHALWTAGRAKVE